MKHSMGIVAVASVYESGGERAENLMQQAAQALEKAGVALTVADRVVWTVADAMEVCASFQASGITSVTIIEASWVLDSLKYLFVQKLHLPVAFWAVPYCDTFSIGGVQHFGSILQSQGIPYKYVYGSADDSALIDELKIIANAGDMIFDLQHLNVALMGPRQSWRVAGPQDMTNEEWEFSQKMGTTIAHLEMDEVLSRIEKISDAEAEKTLQELLPRTGKYNLDKHGMLRHAKIYMAAKDIMKQNHLDIIAAECYPQYCGLMELTSSWLADECIELDTEGDLAHSILMHLMYQHMQGRVALCEVGSIDTEHNYLIAAHAGSSAQSFAGDLARVKVNAFEGGGAFVGTPLKAMDTVTVASFTGKAGAYKMFIGNAKTLDIPTEEWIERGEKMLAYVQFDTDAADVVKFMTQHGIDHHLLIHEGDCKQQLKIFCDYMGIEAVVL